MVREWTKSIGQASAGAGIMLASIIYWWTAYNRARERIGELVGLLTGVATEISSNNRSVIRLLAEPSRLIDLRQDALQSTVWDKSLARISQLLVSFDLLQVVTWYYENIRSLNEAMQTSAHDPRQLEELQWLADECRRTGTDTEIQLRRYIASITGTERQK